MRALAALLVLLPAILLAGCTENTPAPQEARVYNAPVWTVGDEWRWREPDFILQGGGLAGNGTSGSTHDIIWTVNQTTEVAGISVYEVVETGEDEDGSPLGEPDTFYKAIATQEIVNASGPEPSRLKFPFTEGTSFAMDNETEIRVGGPATVGTLAGNFTAVKLEQWSRGVDGEPFLALRFYYAPEVGNVVRWETHYGPDSFTVRELVSYRFQAGAPAS